MKIYLAARYSRRAELNEYAEDLRNVGHIVTSRWLSHDNFRALETKDIETEQVSTPIEAQDIAYADYEDIRDADCLIAFSEAPRAEGGTRGGRHVEFGIAYAMRKAVIVVGPRENVFHTLAGVSHYWKWADCFEALAIEARLQESVA